MEKNIKACGFNCKGVIHFTLFFFFFFFFFFFLAAEVEPLFCQGTFKSPSGDEIEWTFSEEKEDFQMRQLEFNRFTLNSVGNKKKDSFSFIF